jgi:hypothetical protein
VFSQLGPLFKTHLRQAEKSDARLEIRRDEKQEHGKKQTFEEPDAESSDLWEDSTAVSVEALKAFLIQFLKARGDDAPEASPVMENIRDTAQTPEFRPPANNRAAQAVRAYSSMAAQNNAPPPVSQATVPPTQDIDLVSLLAADEIRTMHVLIAELEGLSRKGIQTLTIEKADTFLEALVLSVRAEKAKA